MQKDPFILDHLQLIALLAVTVTYSACTCVRITSVWMVLLCAICPHLLAFQLFVMPEHKQTNCDWHHWEMTAPAGLEIVLPRIAACIGDQSTL